MLRQAKRVVCAVSGGVDSAVSAYLLKKKGYEVIGLFMKNWDALDETGQCSVSNDREDAKFVCDHLKIPFHEVNFVKKFWNEVFSPLIQDYQNGLTPNPDVLCNQHIKFDAFFNYAINNLQADAIATGHYAKSSAGEDLLNAENGVKLLKAFDKVKDQTFFIFKIPQNALQRTIFPIGDLTKNVVKEMAIVAGMERIAKKKESMGICFVGNRNFNKFIEEYIEPKEGKFIHIETGEVMGIHKGTHYWTIGQRALIPGKSMPHYIAKLDPKTQDILVAPGTNHPALYSRTLLTELPYWIYKPPKEYTESQMFTSDFKFQHAHPLLSCTGHVSQDDKVQIRLEFPIRALTKGQYAIFYSGEECLGGARITNIGPSLYDLNHREQVVVPKGFS